MNRRLLRYVLDAVRPGRAPRAGASRGILDTTELWFVLVGQPRRLRLHSFTPGNRLWRKNLRDVDGDGQITSGDGVDLNRNFPTNWNYDDEGSSSDPGERDLPRRRPRVRARDAGDGRPAAPHPLRLPGQLPLGRRAAAVPVRLPGRDLHGRRPDLRGAVGHRRATRRSRATRPAPRTRTTRTSRAELYTTNGETTDHAHTALRHARRGRRDGRRRPRPRRRPERVRVPGLRGRPAGRVREEHPVRARRGGVGQGPGEPGVAPRHDRARLRGRGRSRCPSAIPSRSRRTSSASSARCAIHWTVNGGEARSAPDARVRRAASATAAPATSTTTACAAPSAARARATACGCGSRPAATRSRRSPTRRAARAGAPVLLLAAEDYSGAAAQHGARPRPEPPAHLRGRAARQPASRYDVYDVDAEGRTAPDPLGVLGHYGPCSGTRATTCSCASRGWAPGPAPPSSPTTRSSPCATTSTTAASCSTRARTPRSGSCRASPTTRPVSRRTARPAARCPTACPLSNDFLQYYLGAYLHIDAAATKEEASALPMLGPPAARSGRPRSRSTAPTARTTRRTSYSMLTTSSILPPGDLPAVRLRARRAARPPAGVRPADGLVVRGREVARRAPGSGCARRST